MREGASKNRAENKRRKKETHKERQKERMPTRALLYVRRTSQFVTSPNARFRTPVDGDYILHHKQPPFPPRYNPHRLRHFTLTHPFLSIVR